MDRLNCVWINLLIDIFGHSRISSTVIFFLKRGENDWSRRFKGPHFAVLL